MTELAETHRSYVNTWECDENDHLNVQFYMKRFDEAAGFAALAEGREWTSLHRPAFRHLRYHAELHAGATTVIRSGRIAHGAFAGSTVHRLEDSVTGKLCATALDVRESGATQTSQLPEIAPDDLVPALPRGLTHDLPAPKSKRFLEDEGAFVSNMSVVQPGECGADGSLSAQHHVARFSDGAAQIWDRHLHVPDMLRQGFGRVAMEMRIAFHHRAAAGDPLRLHSIAQATEGRAMILRHALLRATDDATICTGEVVAIILDLKTRRAVDPRQFLSTGLKV